MPKGLVRYQQSGSLHFLTFSCYQRRPLLNSPAAYECFEQHLEAVRRRYCFMVAGYVLMPEHVHLLLSEPRAAPLSIAIQALKQQTSRKLKISGDTQFWQRRYYDFNLWPIRKPAKSSTTCTGIPWSAGWLRSRKTGPGRVFAITQQALRELSRSNPTGL